MGLLLIGGLALTPVMAATDEGQMRKVKVAALDLASPPSRQTLNRRLRVAWVSHSGAGDTG